MASIRIAEIFRSIQGEGTLTGTESVFIRVSGCNLRCWFCDTRYASWEPNGIPMSLEQILESVARWDTRHVVITGGEPMLFPLLVPLTEKLKEAGRHITIETAGTVFRPVACDLMSISPKLSNSTPWGATSPGLIHKHEANRYRPEVIRQLVQQYEYQFKFVIDGPSDLPEVEAYLREFPELQRERIMLMPQGTEIAGLREKGIWIEEYCKSRGLKFCPRRQIEWFGCTPGT